MHYVILYGGWPAGGRLSSSLHSGSGDSREGTQLDRDSSGFGVSTDSSVRLPLVLRAAWALVHPCLTAARFTPWQLIITTLSAVYAFKNADIVLGLGCKIFSTPDNALYKVHVYLGLRDLQLLAAPEPLANLYSPDFYRATWVTTAVDTGFATAQSIQPKFLRDIMSIVFFIYYLFYAREADEKVRSSRATVAQSYSPFPPLLRFFFSPTPTIVAPLQGNMYCRGAPDYLEQDK